jgi:hypothetical protein
MVLQLTKLSIAMDLVRQSLAEAHALKNEGHRDGAYYKHLSTALYTLDLLASGSFFMIDGLDRKTVEMLFGICRDSLVCAGDELDAVLDLSEDDAQKASEMVLLNGTPLSKEPTPSVHVDIQQSQPYTKVGEKDKTEVGISPVPNMLFGPEPQLTNIRDPSDLPLIPVSSLHLDICGHMLELQFLIQHFYSYKSFPAKERANGRYLSALDQLVGKIQDAALAKLDLEVGCSMAANLKIRDIPPSDLARQITRLQVTIFRRIEESELQMIDTIHSPNLAEFLAFRKYLIHWCQYEVLRYAEASDRASTLGHLVKTAKVLFDLANYDGLHALVTGLTALPVERLRETRAIVPKRLHNELESHKLLVAPTRNYAHLRDKIDGHILPCLPLVQLFIGGETTKWREYQSSGYLEMYSELPVVSQYLLMQPFRWEEELAAMSQQRESKAMGRADMPEGLTDAEYLRLSSNQDDAFESVRRRINGGDHPSVSYREVRPIQSIR